MNAERTTTSSKASLPPKYNLELVKCAILETMILELDPQCLKIRELALKIVANPKDIREVETAIQAIHDLRRSNLVRYRKNNPICCRKDNLIVDLTDAARDAHALLMR